MDTTVDITIIAALTHVVAFARREIDDSHISTHRADQRVRDLLEQVIQA